MTGHVYPQITFVWLCLPQVVVLHFRLQQKKNLFFMENSGLVLQVLTCIFRLSDKLLADYGIPIRSWDHARFVNLHSNFGSGWINVGPHGFSLRGELLPIWTVTD